MQWRIVAVCLQFRQIGYSNVAHFKGKLIGVANSGEVSTRVKGVRVGVLHFLRGQRIVDDGKPTRPSCLLCVQIDASCEAREGIVLWCTALIAPFLRKQIVQNFSFVLLQCLRRALYLILLSVLQRIQLGRGRFCFCFFAILVFFLKVLIDPITSN